MQQTLQQEKYVKLWICFDLGPDIWCCQYLANSNCLTFQLQHNSSISTNSVHFTT